MEKPLYRLTSKDFQSGISMLGAHAQRGGIFSNAAGVTPLFGAGNAEDVNNGLLMAGPAGTSINYGSVTGNIMKMIPDRGIFLASPAMIAVTSTNKIAAVRVTNTSTPTFGTLVTQFTTASTMTPGIATFNGYFFYRQIDQIGRYSPQSDTWRTLGINTDYWGAMWNHTLLNKLFFGNGGGSVGSIDSSFSVTTSACTFDSYLVPTAISDDGPYVVIAVTKNNDGEASTLSDTRILYWDGSTTTGYLNQHIIPDPFIYALDKTPDGLFAYGVTGVWQVTFSAAKKIFTIPPGVYTASGSVPHYGVGVTSFYAGALMWAGSSGSNNVIKTLGKLDAAALAAYLQPIKLTSSVNITAISGEIFKGYVFVADSTPALTAYPIGTGTPQTGVSAKTVYLTTEVPMDITHIDVVFGEPLASGDTLTLTAYKDEDTAAVSFGSVSYSSSKTTRRYQFRPSTGGFMAVDEQFAINATFTAGAVKIKSIEVYGKPRKPVNL